MDGSDLPIPFLRKIRRLLLPQEATVYQSRTHASHNWLHSIAEFDEEYRPTLPSLYLDVSAIPAYPLLDSVVECISPELLTRMVYYCEDPGRHLPSPVSAEDREFLCRLYSNVDPRTGFSPVRYQSTGVGRVRSQGSILGAASCFRETIFEGMKYAQLSMVEGYPTLLWALAPLVGVQATGLNSYVSDPERFLEELSEFWSAPNVERIPHRYIRDLLRISIHGGNFSTWIEKMQPLYTLRNHYEVPLVYSQLCDECRLLRDIIVKSNPHLVTLVRGDEEDEAVVHRRTLSVFCQAVEHFVTYQALAHCLESHQIPLGPGDVPSFVWISTGFCWIPTRSALPPADLLASLHTALRTTCGEQFGRITYHFQQCTQSIPAVLDDANPLWLSSEYHNYDLGTFEEPEELPQDDFAKDRTYEEFKEWFEDKLGHFYVYSKNEYGRAYRNKKGRLTRVSWFSTGALYDTYKFVKFWAQDGIDKQTGAPKMKLVEGARTWASDRNLRWYVSAECYPPPMVCPNDVLNLWTESPYHDKPLRQGQNETPECQQAISDFWALMRVVCGDPIEAPAEPSANFKYLRWWVTDMIQRPGVKPGVVPVLVGSEGCGKSLFALILCKIVGEGRYLDTNMENIVGNFNSLLEGRIFVVINEMNKALNSTQACAFKALITDREVTLNKKHHVQREAQNQSRFMITTNDHNILPSERRPFYLRCTLELKRNGGEMLERLWQIPDNPKALAAIYRQFQYTDTIAMFGAVRISPPVDGLNREFRRSTNPYIAFAYYLVNNVWKEQILVTLSGAELHQHWKEYCEAEHITDTKTCMDVTNGLVLTPSWPAGCISEAFHVGRVVKRNYNVACIRRELELGI